MCGKTHVRTDRHSVHVFRRATLIHIGKEVRIIPVFRIHEQRAETGTIFMDVSITVDTGADDILVLVQ